MGRAFPRRGRGRLAGPLEAAALAKPTAPAVCAAVEALRRQRHTGTQIAAEVGVSAATVGRILKRLGLNRLSALEPAEPVRRYERTAPGEIIHIDIKKLGSSADWPSDHRRPDRPEQYARRSAGNSCSLHRRRFPSRHSRDPDGRNDRPAPSLPQGAFASFESLGVKVERVMTDNGSCYPIHRLRKACAGSESSICAPGPTRPEPTARPNASSRPACANGLTPGPTAPLKNAPPNCPSGCTATIGIALMAVSPPSHQSAASAYQGQRVEAPQLVSYCLNGERNGFHRQAGAKTCAASS